MYEVIKPKLMNYVNMFGLTVVIYPPDGKKMASLLCITTNLQLCTKRCCQKLPASCYYPLNRDSPFRKIPLAEKFQRRTYTLINGGYSTVNF